MGGVVEVESALRKVTDSRSAHSTFQLSVTLRAEVRVIRVEAWTRSEARDVKNGFDPMHDAGRLGGHASTPGDLELDRGVGLQDGLGEDVRRALRPATERLGPMHSQALRSV